MFKTTDILQATKGKLITQVAASFTSISTDSRNITNGALYIPIIGKKYDGHAYIFEALKKGAAGILTSKSIKRSPMNKTVIRVKDTILAYQDIALFYRKSFNIPFVGVTGSSGKTTTKDMIASILSKAGNTLKTEENFNNEIGVPKTLLGMKKNCKFAVIEMAMQDIGEIEQLAKITLPQVAVITNIGLSHIKYLKNQNNIAKAKAEILKFQKSSDAAVLPADDNFFSFLKNKAKGRVISFGIDNKADVAAKHIIYRGDSTNFTLHTPKFELKIELPLPGKHNVLDALAAAAVGVALNIDPKKIKKGLESATLSSKRTNIIRKNNVTVIDDTYNANPDSMTAALEMLANYSGRKIAILGDMLELGPIEKKSHVMIGKTAKELDIDIVITVGKLMKNASAVHHFNSNKEALEFAINLTKKGDTILVKGSRGMRMEDIVKGLSK
jgi:UDP-N-acetylmuramoyl-tripeptide--D-alanyl-D-alanine ligase